MSSSPLVSIIVPVYKVEDYVSRTIQSILNQDYLRLELILVDDGSPDDSPMILDQFASQDSRVKVFHQKNSGVSSARNVGLSAATGEYLMFVDGDDWVDEDYVSYFVNLLEASGCSIGANVSNHGGRVLNIGTDPLVMSSESTIEWIYTGKLNVAVWNKIYSAKLIKSNEVWFDPEVWYGEGMLFNIEALQLVDEVAVGSKPVYHQVHNPKSATRCFSLSNNLCGIRSLEIQKEKWTKVTPEIERAWRYHRYAFNRSILEGLVWTHSTRSNRNLYLSCRRELRHNARVPFTASIDIRNKAFWIMWLISPWLAAHVSAMKNHLKSLRSQ